MTAAAEQQGALFEHCREFAKVMLIDSGEFYPFGAEISDDGSLSAVAGWIGEEHPNPFDIHELLKEGFVSKARAGTIIAAALAVNVNVPGQYQPAFPDGVRIQLETSGNSRYIYVPYRITISGLFRKSRNVDFAEPFAVQLAEDWFLQA